MSWDRWTYDEYSDCACGKGKIIAHCWQADDDWNRSESGINSIEITCHDCKKNYHLETIHRYSWCPPWKGSGHSTSYFLVPNGLEIPRVISRKSEYDFYNSFEEQIACQFTYQDIQAVVTDMKDSKYSTRVTLDKSKHLVYLFSKATKTKSLNKIVPALEDILSNYDNYEWNFEKIKKFREEEEVIIAENEKKIEAVKAKSFSLDFRRK